MVGPDPKYLLTTALLHVKGGGVPLHSEIIVRKKVVGPDFQVPFDYPSSFTLLFQNEEGLPPWPSFI